MFKVFKIVDVLPTSWGDRGDDDRLMVISSAASYFAAYQDPEHML